MNPAGGIVDFDQALEAVLQQAANRGNPASRQVALLDSRNRILAEAIVADRDQPPFDRSTRDGFAIRAADAPAGSFQLAGEVRAGQSWQGAPLAPGETIAIMTGAPIPEGADSVVMIEHVEQAGKIVRLTGDRTVHPGENIVPRGSEAHQGEAVLACGTPISAAEIALAAACGRSSLAVYSRPRVAIVATGDELVELDQVVLHGHQIRNSNSYALAALVENAGGEAVRLPIAPDERTQLSRIVEEATRSDLMLLSGGVSMGEYDLVEEVLQHIGAEFFFTGVRMQPGKPVVFGSLPARGAQPAQLFFGLPGNPISTQVTFHCFVEPLLRAMCGAAIQGPRFVQATLAEEIAGKPGLTRFLPARLTSNRVRPEVRLAGSQSSGDLAANARANCYAVLPPGNESFPAGDVITILLR